MGTKINYKSDFDAILHLKDCNDKTREIPFPECDFDVHFWTSSKANAYTASYKDGVYTNCRRTEDGGMHFVFNDHHLGTGVLKWEPHFRLPNDIYPDGIKDTFRKAQLGIELVDGDGDCPTTAEVEALAPYIKGDKGDPFTYADFTPEQIEALMKPAVDAAKSASATEEAISKAEVGRVKAEDARTASELERVKAEAARASEETQRQRAETQRRQSESLRVAAEEIRTTAEEARRSAEAERESAEESRATEFATWESEIDSKADAKNVYTKSQVNNLIQSTDERLNSTITDVNNLTAAKQDKITTSEDLSLSDENELSLTDMAKKRLFIDLWNTACGQYGKYDPENAPDAQHPFMGNEIWMTYEEAVAVYNDGTFDSLASAGKGFIHRTNLPITAFHNPGTIEQSFNSTLFVFNVEVANVASLNSPLYFSAYPISVYHKPFGYAKLRKIIGVIDLHFARSQINWFVGAVNLEEVRIARLAWSINLGSCSKLSLESFRYMIAEAWGDAGNGHSRSITVHPNVYAKLTGDTTNEAAAALTAEELAAWQQIVTDAVAKNISFATT